MRFGCSADVVQMLVWMWVGGGLDVFLDLVQWFPVSTKFVNNSSFLTFLISGDFSVRRREFGSALKP